MNAADTSKPVMCKSEIEASASMSRSDSMELVGELIIKSFADNCPRAISRATRRMRTLVGSFSTHTQSVVMGEMPHCFERTLDVCSSINLPTF